MAASREGSPEEAPPAADAGTAPANPSKKTRKKHRAGGSRAAAPAWDHEPAIAGRRSRSGDRGMWRMIVLGASLVIVLFVVIATIMREPEPPDPVPTPVARSGQAGAATDSSEDSLPAVMRGGEFAFLTSAEPLVRAFLEARSVDELIPLVRNPQVTGPRIMKHHPDGTIDAPGMAVFNSTRTVHYLGRMAAVDVLVGDHQQRQVAMIGTPDGLKVDWESFVGWSEMSWGEFLESKPAEPQVFRVIVRLADYYNFDFADDLQWQSYRLESPDGEHQVFGYAERGSLLDQQMKPQSPDAATSATLALQYPHGKTTRNQFVITRFVMDGWISEDEEVAPDGE